MMKIIALINSFWEWLSATFCKIVDSNNRRVDLIEEIEALRNEPAKGNKQKIRENRKLINKHENIIAVSSLKLICAIVMLFGAGATIIMILRAFAPTIIFIVNGFVNLFYELWRGDITLRSMTFIAGTILTFAAILAVVYHIHGKRTMSKFEEPSEYDYNILLKFVYEALKEIAPVTHLSPPNYSEALKPDNWYQKGLFLRYKFSCRYEGTEIDTGKIFRLFNKVLHRLQRDSHIERTMLAALVGLTVDDDDVHFDIAL